MSGKRLLVVDDEPRFGEFVRKVAVDAGFEVEVTTNGYDFQKRYPVFDPTAVVVDLIMPEIEGIELVQWVAAREAPAHFIVVTGYSHCRYRLFAGVCHPRQNAWRGQGVAVGGNPHKAGQSGLVAQRAG